MGRSGGMVGTLDAGMSIDVSSSGSPRECSDSMEGKLEVDGWEGWLSGGSCDLVSVSRSSFWSVGPPSSSPSSPLPSLTSPLTYEIKFRGLHKVETLSVCGDTLVVYTVNKVAYRKHLLWIWLTTETRVKWRIFVYIC